MFTSLGSYKEIVNPSGFLNTSGKEITIGEYVGKKIILIEFLTYTCNNCQATFPYLVKWDAKYKNQGLITIGIQTPEFAFEKNIKNVAEGLAKYGITFPVVLDNNYSTWNAYANQFWPHRYLIDTQGNIVYEHIGEGDYDGTEKMIQTLLQTLKK